MRIGIDAQLLPRHMRHVGGAGWYMRRSIPELLAHREQEYVVFTDWDGFDALAAPHWQRVPSPWPIRRGLDYHRWAEWVAPGLVRAHRLDVLFSPDAMTSLRAPVPKVCLVHDVYHIAYPELCPSRAQGLYLRWRTGLMARHSSLVLTLSEAVRTVVLAAYRLPADRVRAVNAGGPHEAFLALSRRPHPRPHEQPYLLWVGAIAPYKDVPTLLDAFTIVADAGLPHDLVLVGRKSWGWPAVAARLQSHPYRDRILHIDSMSQERLIPFYQNAEVFVFPSIAEGLATVVLEAMACGAPVIGTDAPGPNDAIGPGGLLVPPRDPAALATQLQAVLADRRFREDLRQRGFRHVATFSWDLAARQLLDAFQSVVPRQES